LFLFRSPLWAISLVLQTFLTPFVFVMNLGNWLGLLLFLPSLLLVLSWADLGLQISVYGSKIPDSQEQSQEFSADAMS
jgi:hypothetical protein